MKTYYTNQKIVFSVKILTIFLFLNCLNSSVYSQIISFSESKNVIVLKNWHYRWGDSPPDASGKPQWIDKDLENPEWMNISDLKKLPSKKDDFIWLRTRIHEQNLENPGLLLPPINLMFELYIGSELVFSNGSLKLSSENKYQFSLFRIIPIKKNHLGKTAFFRIYSDKAGKTGIFFNPVFGEQAELTKVLFKSEIQSFSFGIIFFITGIIAFFIFLKWWKQKLYYVLAFGAFTISIAFAFGLLNGISQMFLPGHTIRYYIGFTSFMAFPVGMWGFYEQIMGESIEWRYKTIARRLWQFHIILASVSLLLDLFNIFTLPEMLIPYYFILGIEIIAVSLFVISKRPKIKTFGFSLKLMHIGFVILAITGMHDILVYTNIINSNNLFFLWGVLCFAVLQAGIVERKISGYTRQLLEYSSELESKSDELKNANIQLEDYSRTLEEKVDNRTLDLKKKNIELQEAMKQLHETQQQLIMQEKMASLGNLVAGVAHEVNNPIGAVNGATDVTLRATEKLKNILKNLDTGDKIQNDKQLWKILDIISNNSGIISTAGKRIRDIVKILKNFARLDEADYQKADLHEGINSTLTLVHHEIKDRIEIIKEYGDIPMINCYPNQLNQVFMNLFVNASHAITEKGIIKIETGISDSKIKIQFSDNGKGIPEDKIKHIFDPGFTTKGVGVGTGLGLSISYNIIKNHKGEIKVESKPGEGTVFTILLPVV